MRELTRWFPPEPGWVSLRSSGSQLHHLFEVPLRAAAGEFQCHLFVLSSILRNSVVLPGRRVKVADFLATERWLPPVSYGITLAFEDSTLKKGEFLPFPKGEGRAWSAVSWWDMRRWEAVLCPQRRKDFHETGRTFLFMMNIIKITYCESWGNGEEKTAASRLESELEWNHCQHLRSFYSGPFPAIITVGMQCYILIFFPGSILTFKHFNVFFHISLSVFMLRKIVHSRGVI